MPNYCIIIGTNRSGSNSKKIAAIYSDFMTNLGQEHDILDLEQLPKDFVFSNMYGKSNPEFTKFQEIVTKTDKFICVIPEYNGSFPGVLKAFIDSCKFPESFMDKKCCLVGLSAGQFGNVRGIEHFTGIANYINMDVWHANMYFPGVDRYLNEDGSLKDEKMGERIKSQLTGFIGF